MEPKEPQESNGRKITKSEVVGTVALGASAALVGVMMFDHAKGIEERLENEGIPDGEYEVEPMDPERVAFKSGDKKYEVTSHDFSTIIDPSSIDNQALHAFVSNGQITLMKETSEPQSPEASQSDQAA